MGQVARGIVLHMALGAGLLLACGGAPAVEVVQVGPPHAAQAAGAAASGPVAAGPAAAPVGRLIADCAGLAASAATSPEDAALFIWTCPEAQANKSALRGALLAAGSPAEAAALAPKLAAAPDLQGLARLAAVARAPTLPAELPDPLTAPSSPVDDAVLAGVARAIGAHTQGGLTHEVRTKAMAYLARTHHEALAQLGLPEGQPLPPFARLLAGRFLHFGRSFCTMYWQRRVAGLEGLFAATEAQLLRVVLALEASPHADDDALLAVERQRARRHLQGSGVAERLKSKGVAGSPADLQPLPHELDRLVDHGFVELAIQRALFLAGEPPTPYGIGPMSELLEELLGDRDLGDFKPLLAKRVADARALQPPPPEQGARPLPPRALLKWKDAGAVAEEAAGWLTEAAQAGGFPRKYGLGRAALLLRDRPDAARVLLRGRPSGIAGALALELLDRLESSGLAWLRLHAAADPSGDASLRRRFALASRDAGLLPR